MTLSHNHQGCTSLQSANNTQCQYSGLLPKEPCSCSHAACRISRKDFFQSFMQQPPPTFSDLISSSMRFWYAPLPSVDVKQILYGTYLVTSGREAKTDMAVLATNDWKMPSDSYGINGRDLSSLASLLNNSTHCAMLFLLTFGH